jgi:hypothetical protein
VGHTLITGGSHFIDAPDRPGGCCVVAFNVASTTEPGPQLFVFDEADA